MKIWALSGNQFDTILFSTYENMDIWFTHVYKQSIADMVKENEGECEAEVSDTRVYIDDFISGRLLEVDEETRYLLGSS